MNYIVCHYFTSASTCCWWGRVGDEDARGCSSGNIYLVTSVWIKKKYENPSSFNDKDIRYNKYTPFVFLCCFFFSNNIKRTRRPILRHAYKLHLDFTLLSSNIPWLYLDGTCEVLGNGTLICNFRLGYNTFFCRALSAVFEALYFLKAQFIGISNWRELWYLWNFPKEKRLLNPCSYLKFSISLNPNFFG